MSRFTSLQTSYFFCRHNENGSSFGKSQLLNGRTLANQKAKGEKFEYLKASLLFLIIVKMRLF